MSDVAMQAETWEGVPPRPYEPWAGTRTELREVGEVGEDSSPAWMEYIATLRTLRSSDDLLRLLAFLGREQVVRPFAPLAYRVQCLLIGCGIERKSERAWAYRAIYDVRPTPVVRDSGLKLYLARRRRLRERLR